MTTRRRVAGIAVLLAPVLLVAGMSGALAVSTSDFETARLATLTETTAQNEAIELRLRALDETLEVRRLMVAAKSEITAAQALELHAGVLSQSALDALTSARKAVVEANPTDIRAVPVIPDLPAERSDWTTSLIEMRITVKASGAELLSRLRELDSAVILVAAASASGVDSILAANPLASAESKALLSATGVRIEQGLEHGGELLRRIHDHVAAVRAVQASQAEAAAAAAAAASASAGSGGGGSRSPGGRPLIWPGTFEPTVEPIIYVNEYYLPGCAGYDSWVFEAYYELGEGEEIFIDWPVDYDFLLYVGVHSWILGVKTCIDPYPL